MAGRRPKPLAMHQLNGNPRHFSQADLKGDNNPQPNVGEPEMPRYLTKAGRREWKRIVPLLFKVGVLTEIDGLALAGYCDNVATIEAMRKDIRKNGYTFVSKFEDKHGNVVMGDIKPNPAVGMLFKAEGMMKSFLIEFGLTPASRSRLKIAKKDDGDAMSQFLNRKAGSLTPFKAPEPVRPVINPADMLADDPAPAGSIEIADATEEAPE